MMRAMASALVATWVAACAPAPVGNRSAAEPRPLSESLVPSGYGTLRQDEFTVALRSGALLIKVTPLAESITRLAAPDTYARLHALAASLSADAERDAGVASPTLFLVSFFSYEPDTRFQPDDLQFLQQGRLHRARAILPVTPGWPSHRLEQQETRSAVYAFDPELDPELPFRVRYANVESDDWLRILPRLQSERAKIRARAG